MSREPPGRMQIGEVLREARKRSGLELREVEQRTKIRFKYLRALEAEDWGELPNSAYAKGFLRTYAAALGLDAEALVDEYRRQVEGTPGEPAYAVGDQVLEHRRRAGERRGSSRWPLVAAVAVAVAIVVVAAIGLVGDDDDGPGGDRDGRRAKAGKGKHGGNGQGQRQGRGNDARQRSSKGGGTVTVALSIRDSVEVCLLGGQGQPLIAQVLAPGTEESFERREFELRFPSGFDPDEFKLEIAGRKRTLPRASGPVAYSIVAPRRVTELARAPGEECP